MRFTQRIFFLAIALLLASCGKDQLYQEQGYVFGTLVEVSVYGEGEPKARQAVTAVMNEFQRLHDMLHAWRPSELSSVNAAFAKGESRQVSPEMATILQDAAQLSAQSDGLFNPAIGGLVQLWGFHADEFKAVLPAENKIAALVAAKPQMSDLVFDDHRVGSSNKAVQLDLGGYAKGYALDRAAELLRKMNVHNALINIGGNVLALGQRGSRPWRVGIQHPRKPGPLATLDLHDGEAIGTSGDYQRFFELDGKRYCHLIDPRTGQPVQGVEAVTVLTHGAKAGVLSDADSKPLFISGGANWRKAAQQVAVDEAMLIDSEGTVHLTAALQKRLEFVDQATDRKVEP